MDFDRLIRSQRLWLFLVISIGFSIVAIVAPPILNPPRSAVAAAALVKDKKPVGGQLLSSGAQVTPTAHIMVSLPITPTVVPTRTPFPTARPTNTPFPTRTPFPTARATDTSVPTRTPFPTANPTDTSVPTRTTVPTLAPVTATVVPLTVAVVTATVEQPTVVLTAEPTAQTVATRKPDYVHPRTKTKNDVLFFVPEPGECWLGFISVPSWLYSGVGSALTPCTQVYVEPGIEYFEPGESYTNHGETTPYRVVSRDNRLKFSGVQSEKDGIAYYQVVPIGQGNEVYWVRKE